LKLPAKVLSSDPLIYTANGVLHEEECRHLQSVAEPGIRPSFVIDPTSGRRMPHPVRTSDGTSIGPTEEDLVINNINRRLAVLTKTEATSGEPLHILRYRPGQEYKPHLDGLSKVANQRVWTVLAYLNDDYEGGETEFPKLSIRYRGQTGDALIFRNVLPDGQPDQRTQHAGLPVVSGVKWLATRWIRMKAYDPWDEGAVVMGA
jgi:prolyl 4-hydroxylase